MWERGIIENPTLNQMLALLELLQETGGVLVRSKSGAEAVLDRTDPGRLPVVICDAGILDGLITLNSAWVDHRHGLIKAREIAVQGDQSVFTPVDTEHP